MSSEFAASETTPLRRTETNANSGCIGNNNSSSNSSNSNNNNNNSIRLDPDRIPATKMDTNYRILTRVAIDFIVLLCVGFPVLFFFLWGEPYERGFFCDDESLKHPFHDSTIKNWMLYIVGLALPISIIIATEVIVASFQTDISRQRYKFQDWDIPPWVVEVYKKVGVFGFGAAASQLTIDIAKYSIGRLRPHFYSVCQPRMVDGSDCSSPKNFGKYIVDFECTGNPSPRVLKEMRLSFPSGHSSFSAYTMVYCAIYLQSRMTWRGSKLLRHFLQFLLVMMAWYTALSRVSDYKHHWSDAAAGTVIGTLCALVVANFVSDLVDRRKTAYLPSVRQELTTLTLSPNNGRV